MATGAGAKPKQTRSRINAETRARLGTALTAAYATGGTMTAIAAEFGVSMTVAFWEAKRLGLKFRQGRRGASAENQKRLPLIAAMYRDGYTLAKIGQQYGITRERVRQLLTKRLGITGKDGGETLRRAREREEKRQRREAECRATHGCSCAQLRELRRIGRQSMLAGIARERTPIGAFITQRTNSRCRGIGWELNLWEWWTLWQESGHWAERGRGNGYVMCRVGDLGPYALGNVFIATGAHNSSHTKNKKSGLPTGVSFIKNGKYEAYVAQRMVNGKNKHLGSHKTPELAHAAYLAAAPTNRRAA